MLQLVKNQVKCSKGFIWSMLVAILVMMTNISVAQSGEEAFKANCAVCHKTTDAKFVGPGLKDVTERRSREWLLSWTKNSQGLLASGDSVANAIFNEYSKSVMPPFDFLGDEVINSIFDYLSTANPPEQIDTQTSSESVIMSDVAEEPTAPAKHGLLYWLGIGFIAVVLFVLYSTLKNVRKALDENGYLNYRDYNKNYFITFVVIAGCTAFIIFLLQEVLALNIPGISNLMFGALPYIALVVFFIGSIFRYMNIGFKVSSLSSQFLEGRELFFGSQPFHWGMLILFLGHLTAFLIPKAVIIWNGNPLRLIILEACSLAFAISALIGLLLLIKRRFTNRRIMVVTNRMDTLVYVVLLVQILSGISIALFARWGSNWFAASITPYLRSIFIFDPQIGVATAMPWYAQIHIISAFFIVAIIPFTRFMHFLVAPIHYIWRKYQLVYWNWNRKSIRKSTAHTYGKLPRNH